jgi:hypothetical protein
LALKLLGLGATQPPAVGGSSAYPPPLVGLLTTTFVAETGDDQRPAAGVKPDGQMAIMATIARNAALMPLLWCRRSHGTSEPPHENPRLPAAADTLQDKVTVPI